ncbi:MAG: Uncharacterized protein Athens071426_601 [Parcubacteria group bacterium Athens0714_26]|nr:MAG: Uncharacterized protein Athens071426_601 [Parcubacteria group bacterium Athens0714_26]
MQKSYTQRKGFTLVELLIVIGILAILATVTVLVLNPAQLFAQARDSQGVSDLGTLNSALAYYLSTASTTDLDGSTTDCSTRCYVQTTGLTGNGCAGAGTARHGAKTVTIDADRTVDSLGWIPVYIGGAVGGSPISVLPVDPTNTTTYFYSYACDNTNKTYELDANLESARYIQDGSDDKESTDGGNVPTLFELGTDPGLDL